MESEPATFRTGFHISRIVPKRIVVIHIDKAIVAANRGASRPSCRKVSALWTSLFAVFGFIVKVVHATPIARATFTPCARRIEAGLIRRAPVVLWKRGGF